MALRVKNKDFMLKAIELAKRGFGAVEPNPMVGCVIVKDSQIIGEGWHKQYGEAHAEINALADCKRRGNDPKGATMCVTLEPCCHSGKTPPCTNAIIDAQIAKVVVAMEDPSAKVSGKGIKQLEEAGIKVTLGACNKAAQLLNPGFIKQAISAKPWVILKWAQTIDAKLSADRMGPDERWISNDVSRKDCHKLRRSCQGILIGIDTLLKDDPTLTPRPSKGKNLLRIVLDSNLRIPLESKLIKTIDKSGLLVVTSQKSLEDNAQKVSKIIEKGGEVIALPQKDGYCNLGELLSELGKRDIQRLLVEGGAKVISSFLRENLADEVIVYIAPKLLAGKGDTNITTQLDDIPEIPPLFYSKTELFGDDVKMSGWLRHITQIGI